MIPRIRGRVGTGDDGKFYFEISVWNLAGTACYTRDTIGPWETKLEAHKELKNCARMVSESFEKGEVGSVSGKYLDMKDNGTLKDWEPQ